MVAEKRLISFDVNHHGGARSLGLPNPSEPGVDPGSKFARGPGELFRLQFSGEIRRTSRQQGNHRAPSATEYRRSARRRSQSTLPSATVAADWLRFTANGAKRRTGTQSMPPDNRPSPLKSADPLTDQRA